MLVILVAISLGASALWAADPPTAPAKGEPVPLPDAPEQQFDFWQGEWDVTNWHPNAEGEWQETGEAHCRAQSVAGGNALLERWIGVAQGRLIGFSLRAYDPEREIWEVYLNWHTGEPTGFFVMHGERDGDAMLLFPPGNKTAVRYTFSRAHENSCQWDLARSQDGGKTWATQWVMHFSRRGEPRVENAASVDIEKVPREAKKFEATRELDDLIGVWTGTVKSADGDDTRVDVRVTPMIEGFGLLQFTDTSSGDQDLLAMAWEKAADSWSAVGATSRAIGLTRFEGELADGGATFTAEQTRESWIRQSDDRYTWRRESRDGDAWTVSLEVELERVD
ncbi:MAG: hypothetical protein AAGD38_17050 [Acidobacteriota bacterium]